MTRGGMPAPRSNKHEHALRIIGHRIDKTGVLVVCGVLGCTHMETHLLSTMRVKIGPRKYRKATLAEFREQFRGMEHTCCPASKTGSSEASASKS